MFPYIYFVVLAIVIPILYWCQLLFKFRSIRNIPGPTPIPIIGNLCPKTAYELRIKIMEWQKRYGQKFKIFIGPELRVIFSNPKDIEQLLASTVHITKSQNYYYARPWLGDGLLLSTGAKWKERRRLLTPAFHFKILEQFIDIYNSNGDTLVKQLQKQVGKKIIDIYQFANLFALDVICETSMGVKINSQENENIEYVIALKTLINIIRIRLFSVWERSDIIFKLFSSHYKMHQKCVKILHDFTNGVIEKRRREFNNAKQNKTLKETPEVDSYGIKRKAALLDTLLQCESLTNEDIREEIDTFMFEGHDTVTTAISFTLYEIAQNPPIQKKLYEEIVEVIGRKEKEITTQQLQEMNYLDMVVKEGLRLFASVPAFERELQEDCIIDGVKYPKGLLMAVFVYALHRDPEIYPDPEKFIPERFTMENQLKRSPFAYIPFSGGSRNCIGQRFAIMELKIAIVKVIQNLELVPIPGFHYEMELDAVMRSRNGICVQVNQRTK